MIDAINPTGKAVRTEITDELDRIREKRLSTCRRFDDVQRELDVTIRNLQGTIDPELKLKFLRKMRLLIEEADCLLSSKE
jgi:hypothetical protein